LRALFLLFLIVPIIEMYVLIRVGEWIGAWPTIGLVLLTAMIGVALLRQQGFATLARGMRRLDIGEVPAQEMLEGLMLAVGGALLLTPGFVTDVFGFACLLPPTRRAMVALVLRRAEVRVMGGDAGGFEHAGERRGPDVIDGEFRREGPRERHRDGRDEPGRS